MTNFVKGIIVGIFNIVPGLSGCSLLVAFNLYEKCLKAIGNLFKKPKDSFLFLFPIGFGIIIGTYSFSNIIFILLKKHQSFTYIVFTFFILGTIPHLLKEATKKGIKKTYIIAFLITFALGTSLLLIDRQALNYNINYTYISFIKYIVIGIILSFSTVIPGISSTVLLSIMNLYGIYIYSISTLNLFVLIPTILGFVITTFLLSKLIIYLLENYYGYTYFAILGFSLSTIPYLLKVDIVFSLNLLFSIATGIIAFVITYYSFKVMK